jgi:hypothetical protein
VLDRLFLSNLGLQALDGLVGPPWYVMRWRSGRVGAHVASRRRGRRTVRRKALCGYPLRQRLCWVLGLLRAPSIE